MALTSTIYRVDLALSDVDRGVYETLELRLALHPSETLRFLVTRTIAYALEYEEGIAWSRGGISSTDEPPISVRDATGILLAWIDVGLPSAERLHKASKAARRVALYTTAEPAHVRREASQRAIHRAAELEVVRIDPTFVDAIGERLERTCALGLTRNEGHLYAEIGDASLSTELSRIALAPESAG